MSLYFLLRTALIAGVVGAVAGVVSIGFIIATVVVIIVCLLIVGVFKRRKNSLGKDYTTTKDYTICNIFIEKSSDAEMHAIELFPDR